MSVWHDARWQTQGATDKIVEPFDPLRIEDAKYMLSVGDEVYVSEEGSKRTAQKLKEGESFAIDSGQFAFLLTEETVRLPFDVLGFISIRAKVKFSGLVNISGFHVDPGWEGKLIFSVFNAGPARIQLKRGDLIFSIWLADLQGPISRTSLDGGFKDIPSKLITPISGKFTTAYQLEKEINTLKDDIANLKAFKLQALVFLAIATTLLLPVFKDTFVKLLDSVPVSRSDSSLPVPALPPTQPPRQPPK
jgi:dCTP deaminase